MKWDEVSVSMKGDLDQTSVDLSNLFYLEPLQFYATPKEGTGANTISTSECIDDESFSFMIKDAICFNDVVI